MHACIWQCSVFQLEIIGTEIQLRFQMYLVQTAIGKSKVIKAVKRCTARHSLLYQYIDYTESGVWVCIVGSSGKKRKFVFGNGKNDWKCSKKLIAVLLSEGLERVLVNSALCSTKSGLSSVRTAMHCLKVKKSGWSKNPQVKEKEKMENIYEDKEF